VNTDMRADRFENRLLAAILDDFPNLADAEARSGRYHESTRPAGSGRARGRGGLALLAGTAAVAAGVASAFGAGAFSAGGHALPGRTTVPARLSADYVVNHVKAAVHASGTDVIEYDLGHAPNSQTGELENTATWAYGNSARMVSLTQDLDAAGKPVLGYLMTVTPDKTVTITINYSSRTWATTTYPFGSATPANAPGPRPQSNAQAAAALWNAVKAGSVTVVGPAEVDGQRAIHLVQGSSRAGEIDMWVNPATYLPIRTIDTAPGESVTSSHAIRDDYQWLPDTAANMRLLTVAGAIPAGFAQVSSASTSS
jgi:hypothetical protein